MADVNLPSRLSESDRGQLFLVTALAVAVMLVGLALILNTAIYTENIATRTTDTQLDEAASAQRAAVEASGEILDAENRKGGSNSDIKDRFVGSVRNWSTTSATLGSASGFTAELSYAGSYEQGARVYQDTPSARFTDTYGDPSWNVTTQEEIRRLRINVSQSSLESSQSDAFRLVFDDDHDGDRSDAVNVSIHDDGPSVNVTVEDDAGYVGSCDVEPIRGDYLVVDVGERTVGNRYCEPLETVHDSVDGRAELRFENGDEASGTYELYVDTNSGSLLTLAPYTGGGKPNIDGAVYDANVTFVFHASGTAVEKEIRIAPGEL